MMNFDGAEVRDGFERAFGKKVTELTEQQLRWLVNVAKHCRGRCRSNAALYNYLNRNFVGHVFKEVQVDGEDFPRLEIRTRVPRTGTVDQTATVDRTATVDQTGVVGG